VQLHVFLMAPNRQSHASDPENQIQNHITTLRPTVSRPVFSFLLLKLSSDNCGFGDVGRPLRREDGPVIYSCCWASPAQSLSCPSCTGLVTTFYCLQFETPPTWRASFLHFFPQGQGSPVTLRQWVRTLQFWAETPLAVG
jgi:hypothetical protein